VPLPRLQSAPPGQPDGGLVQSVFPVQRGHWHKKPTGTTKSHIYGAQQGQIAEQYPPKERHGQVVGVGVGVGGFGVAVAVGVAGGVVGVGVAQV